MPHPILRVAVGPQVHPSPFRAPILNLTTPHPADFPSTSRDSNGTHSGLISDLVFHSPFPPNHFAQITYARDTRPVLFPRSGTPSGPIRDPLRTRFLNLA